MTSATRAPPPPATPARRAPVRGRVPLGTTVSAETFTAIEAFAPPKRLGLLVDLCVGNWTRMVARRLARESAEVLAEITGTAGALDADTNLEIRVALAVIDGRAAVGREVRGGMTSAQLAQAARDIDTRHNGCPPPLEAIRLEVYAAEAARLDAERGAKKGGGK